MFEKKKHLFRPIILLGSLILFLYFWKRTYFPLPDKYPVNLYFRLDALQSITSTLITGHFCYFFIPALIVLFITLLIGNFFCFWICPLGGLIDTENWLFLRRKWRFKLKKLPGLLRKIRFFMLGVIILASGLGFFIIQVPYLAWLPDPLVILSRALIEKQGWLVGLLSILVLSLVIPRAWCNIFCPQGALFFLVGTKIRGRLKMIRRRKNRYEPEKIP